MPSRRRLLAATATATAAGLAGCNALSGDNSGAAADPSDDSPPEVHVDAGWPNPRRDPAHTAWAPDASVTDPSVEWRSEPVPFNAKPIVSGATVVTGSERLRGFDVLSGDRLWTAEYGTGAWAPPVVDDVAYAPTENIEGMEFPGVVAVSVVDGTRLRSVPTNEVPRLPPTRSFDLSRDRRYLPVQSGVRAYTPEDDRDRQWLRGLFGAHDAPLALNAGLVVASTEAGELTAFASDGTGRWRTDLDDFPTTPPVVGGQHVYVGTHEAVVALARLDGGERWRVDRAAGLPLALDDGRLYAARGDTLTAHSPKTGGVVWEVTLSSRATAAPAVAGDAVLVGTDGGTIEARDAASGAERWSVSVGTALGPTIAAASDRAYAVAETGGDYRVVSLA
jgi:outer membrane protein assembly factor BamB